MARHELRDTDFLLVSSHHSSMGSLSKEAAKEPVKAKLLPITALFTVGQIEPLMEVSSLQVPLC